MPMASVEPPSQRAERLSYVERAAPVVFPESAEVPESQLHLDLRTLLYLLLRRHFGEQLTVGSDQFVYFDGSDPSACLAPDVYVGSRRSSEPVRSWKVWERGAPQVAVEIISESDAPELAWEQKLSRYHRAGVTELVRFDVEHEAQPLRVWDRVDGALNERAVQRARAPSLVLPVSWVVAPGQGLPRVLRVERDGVLLPTAEEAWQTEAEARQAEAEARRAEAEGRRVAEQRAKAETEARQAEAEARRAEAGARQAEAEARQAAEKRVTELEAELRRRR